jgi:hypothetical protein
MEPRAVAKFWLRTDALRGERHRRGNSSLERLLDGEAYANTHEGLPPLFQMKAARAE